MTTLLGLITAFIMTACNTNNNNQSATIDTANPNSIEQNTYKNINGTSFAEKMQDSSTLVLDVRTPGEVQEGYIKGADLFIDINDPDFASKINALDRSKTYLVYCRSGARSSRASSFMIQNGFANVYNLSGGIMSYQGEIATE